MRAGVAAILVASILAAGCKTVPKEGTGTADGSTPKVETGQSESPGSQAPEAEGPTTIEERWQCGDIRLISTCIPKLGDSFCVGTVKTGKYPAKNTLFSINGVERRWSWFLKDGGYRYTFVIASGFGRYYDFHGVPAGERTKPSGVFTCSETWW